MVEVVKAKATHWFASRRVSTNTFGLFDAITDDEPLGLPQAVHAPSCQSEPKRRRSPKLSCHRLRLSYSRTSSLTRCAGTAGLSTLTRTPILGLSPHPVSCLLPPSPLPPPPPPHSLHTMSDTKIIHRVIRKIAGWAVISFFSEVHVIGEENVPRTGPIIA